MKVINTRIPEVKVIEPRVFEDERGYFLESYRESLLEESGITESFIQDNISKSFKGTVRGLHYQLEQPQAKLVQCIVGTILDVAVDVRYGSKTFGQYVATQLSAENHKQMYVPVGFAHGFSVLSDEAVVYYKCSDYYHQPSERGVRWDDPDIRINWGVDKPVLSDKDRIQPLLKSIAKNELFS
ncbi:MAG: dTDP-4-dehydrorhamnose 3,5-epimerase [bacterium]|nr:dTDP-4-dehydrorhamnose 3,5-epimerase [bacterium]